MVFYIYNHQNNIFNQLNKSKINANLGFTTYNNIYFNIMICKIDN